MKEGDCKELNEEKARRVKAASLTYLRNFGAIVTIIVLYSLIVFPSLDFGQVFQVSEAREGVVIHEMLEGQEYILPLRHGKIVPSKPPLFHWIAVLLHKAFDLNQEWTLRLPSAIAALGILLWVAHFVTSIAGLSVALVSVAVLSTMYGFFRMATDGRVDMVFTFFVIGALLTWFSAFFKKVREINEVRKDVGELSEKGDPGSGADTASHVISQISPKVYWIVGLLCGLAILAKGPLGLLLPFLIISAFLLSYSRAKDLMAVCRLGWLLALVVAVPWYLVSGLRKEGDFIGRQIIFENVTRYFGGGRIDSKPVWFYLEHIWTQAAPWSFFILVLSLFAGWIYWKDCNRREFFKNLKITDERRKLLLKTMLIWFVVVFIFLSSASGKRRAYLLPLLPPLSVIIAIYLSAVWSGVKKHSAMFGKTVQKIAYVFQVLLLISLLLFLVIMTVGVFDNAEWAGLKSVLGQNLNAVHKLINLGVLPILSVGILMAVASFLFLRQSIIKGSGPLLMMGVFFLVEFAFLAFIVPGLAVKGETHSYKVFARQVVSLWPSNEVVKCVKNDWDESLDGFFFYVNRRMPLVPPAPTPENTGTYVARRSWYDAQTPEFKAATELIAEGGRLRDTPEQKLVMFKKQSNN